jgi:hypothetical protein
MSGRVYARKFDWDEARRLRAEGASVSEISQQMRVTKAAIWRVVTPGAIEKEAEYHRRLARTGICDECGGPMNRLSRYRGATRCAKCAALANATTVRPDALLCSTCREWKPDEDFPSGNKTKARRGRHSQCRVCLTLAKRDYRRRNRERERAYDRAYRARRRTERNAA